MGLRQPFPAGGAGLYRRALAYGAQGRRAGRAGLHPAGGRPGAAGQSRRCATGGDPQPALAKAGGQAAGGTGHRAQRGVQRQAFRAAERRVDRRRAEPAPGARFLRPARAADPPSGTAARGAAPGRAARGRRRVARSRAELAATGSGPARGASSPAWLYFAPGPAAQGAEPPGGRVPPEPAERLPDHPQRPRRAVYRPAALSARQGRPGLRLRRYPSPGLARLSAATFRQPRRQPRAGAVLARGQPCAAAAYRGPGGRPGSGAGADAGEERPAGVDGARRRVPRLAGGACDRGRGGGAARAAGAAGAG
ncbi:Uncharacterised protein [Klebsiella pneumoniae]|nr:Uncharacterised protein [Klebsiella pneumoniae]